MSAFDSNVLDWRWLLVVCYTQIQISFSFKCSRNKELTPENNIVDNLFKFLISKENDTVRPRVINIMGRNVKFAKACGRVIDCTFLELCDRVSTLDTTSVTYNITAKHYWNLLHCISAGWKPGGAPSHSFTPTTDSSILQRCPWNNT